jgi:SAM-dependent methyltransferase
MRDKVEAAIVEYSFIFLPKLIMALALMLKLNILLKLKKENKSTKHLGVVMALPFEGLLRCPACDGDLAIADTIATCQTCEHTYRPTGKGDQWDLRLSVPRNRNVTYRLGEAPTAPVNLFEKLPANPKVKVRDWSGLDGELTYGNRLTPELISYFPRAQSSDTWMLDLGCGARNFESICKEVTNFNYVGIDYEGSGPDLLADAHALPFKDGSFEFVISIAVLEHLAFPDVAIEEAFRVLKPGGIFVGTVAFLEPFHMDSYYHMTHLGTARVLKHAGFDIIAMAPNPEWSGTRAQAEMTLFPGLPRAVKRNLTSAVTPISKGFWAFRRALRNGDRTSNLRRLVETTGGYRFVAVRAP